MAYRWKLAWPEWRPDVQRWLREPTDKCGAIVPNRFRRIAHGWRQRTRLGTIGLHREQRFGCRELADDEALLTCMVYVDVNQIKAGLAATLEESRTSAIAARLAAWRAREAHASLEEFHGSRGGGYDLSLEQVEALLKDAWLAPICTGGLLITQSVTEVAGGSSSLEVAGEAEAALPDSPGEDSELGHVCPAVAAAGEASAEPARFPFVLPVHWDNNVKRTQPCPLSATVS